MMAQTLRIGISCRLIVALILALCLVPVGQAPAVALSVDDYFTISYEVEFSKDVVYGNEVFYAAVTARATCTKDLPLAVSEAVVTGRVIAENEESGTKVVLNSSYTVSISPFPNKEGEASQVSQSVALQFPAGSEAGGYKVAGELIEAKVKAILWFTVTAYLPSSQEMGSVTYLIDSGGGGGDTAKPAPPGTTSTEGKINWRGIITETIIASSEDYRCSITLYEGTKAVDKNGWPLKEISIVEIKDPPAPPEERSVIGLAYNIGPGNAVFEPPAILALAYDKAQVPAGVDEEELVIATWDEAIGEWVELEGCFVDPVTNTITVPVSHFTAFTIMAHTAPPVFTISGLSISAAEVGVGQSVAISVVVANSGNLAGSYQVTLKINGEVEESREITLAGGAREVVTFNVVRDAADIYVVDVNGLLGSFVVKEEALPVFTISGLSISAAEVGVGQSVAISVVVANSGNLAGSYQVTLKINGEVEESREITLAGGAREVVTFNVVRDAADIYVVDINGLLGSFVVKEEALPVFTISGLSISAAEVGVGQSVAISVVVANSGNLAGSYQVTLKINGEVEESREITLAGGAREVVTFDVVRDAADIYVVDVNGLLGSFVVREEAPLALTPILAAPESTNWWLVGGIYAADVVLLIIILRLIRRWRQ